MNKLSLVEIDRIIEMAWEDRTTFDAIKFQFGLKEQEVIELMRLEMKPKSFKLWRKRVHNTSIKHRKKFKLERKKIREKVKIADIY